MAKARDPHNYVEYRQGRRLWAVVWKEDVHSFHPTRKRANIALWKLKKIHQATGASPLPLSRLDRIIQDDWLENKQQLRVAPKRSVGGLPCPDCGGTLHLRTGKFGFFYGCENYSKTLCRGSVSADANGIPTGVPANAATRRARYLLRVVLSQSDQVPYPVKDMTLEQCQAAITELCRDNPELVEALHNAPEHRHLTRLERLMSDRDPLDRVLGPVGVNLEP